MFTLHGFKGMRVFFSVCMLTLLSLLPVSLCAQRDIRGVVRDSLDKAPIDMVNIILINPQTRMVVTRTMSDDNGVFVLKGLSEEEIAVGEVKATRVGYRAVTFRLKDYVGGGVFMARSTARLKEVIVHNKLMNRWGDTITYVASAIRRAEDDSLEDLLRRLPGVEVSTSGAISYAGKPINKFYIEGLDLLESRYTLASRNISAHDVGSIQVLENHVPIKVNRQDTSSERAAMNIKLTDKAKSRWIFRSEGAVGGWPLIGALDATVMRFGSTAQSLLSAKWDNAGNDIIYQLREQSIGRWTVFSPSEIANNVTDIFSSPVAKTSFNERDRERDNKTGLLSLNHLIKLSDDSNIKGNFAVFVDDNARSLARHSSYLSKDGSRADLSEVTDICLRRRGAENDLLYELNKDDIFVKDRLRVYLYKSSAGSTIFDGNKDLTQDLQLPQAKLSNILSMIKTFGSLKMSLSNETHYTHRPQEMLLISPTERVLHRATDTHVGNHLSSRMTFRKGAHFIEPTVGLEWQKYDLWVPKISGEILPIEASNIALDAYILSKYTYRHNDYSIEFTPGLHRVWERYAHKGWQAYILPSASLSVGYKSKGCSSTSLSYAFSETLSDIRNVFSGDRQTSFHSFRSGLDQNYTTRSHSLSLYHFGTLVLQNLSYSLLSSFMRTTAPWSLSTIVRDNTLRQVYIPKSSYNNIWFVKLNGGHRARKIGLSTLAGLSYNYASGTLSQQGESFSYISHQGGVTLGVRWSPNTILSMDYSQESSIDLGRLPSGGGKTVGLHTEHTLSAFVWLSKIMGFSPKGQYYREKVGDHSPLDILFLDASLQFFFKKFQINIDLTNILDKDHIIRSRHTDVNIHTQKSKLRGREILFSIKFKT